MNFFHILKSGVEKQQKSSANSNTKENLKGLSNSSFGIKQLDTKICTCDEFQSLTNRLVDNTLDSLNKIWTEAGYQDAEKLNLLNNFYFTLETTCINEIQAENDILEHSKREVINKISEYLCLCQELARHEATMETVSKSIYANSTTTSQLAGITKLIENISAEIASRSDVLEIEYCAIKALQMELGDQDGVVDALPTTNTDTSPILLLSDIRLDQLKNLKLQLENVKIDRIDKMKDLMRDTHQLYMDMNVFDELNNKNQISLKYASIIQKYGQLYKSSSNMHVWDFGVHINLLTGFELELVNLTNEKEIRRTELASTGAEIARLWSLLRISSAERDNFSKSFKMNLSLDTICRGRKELERLQTIRAESLAKIITVIRSDIVSLWDELSVTSQPDRIAEFPGYFTSMNQLKDSAVEEHDQYFQKIRTKVEKLRPLLAKILRRELIVQDRVDLEHLMLNPERLTARGPNAKEERKKEESMINRVKNLEKLTTEILQNVKSWEEAHGPFFYMGVRYVERVIEQEESYEATRDQLRAARRKKDGKSETPAKPLPYMRKNATIANAAVLQGLISPAPSAVCKTPSNEKACGQLQTHGAKSMPLSRVNDDDGDEDDDNDENCVHHNRLRSMSTGSENTELTEYTSATEVRETASVCTVKKVPNSGRGNNTKSAVNRADCC